MCSWPFWRQLLRVVIRRPSVKFRKKDSLAWLGQGCSEAVDVYWAALLAAALVLAKIKSQVWEEFRMPGSSGKLSDNSERGNRAWPRLWSNAVNC